MRCIFTSDRPGFTPLVLSTTLYLLIGKLLSSILVRVSFCCLFVIMYLGECVWRILRIPLTICASNCLSKFRIIWLAVCFSSTHTETSPYLPCASLGTLIDDVKLGLYVICFIFVKFICMHIYPTIQSRNFLPFRHLPTCQQQLVFAFFTANFQVDLSSPKFCLSN